MTYCFQCGHLTGGKPLFCSKCGSSFDVKLCPRLHVNSRIAEVCSKCGSHELSSPQPRVPFLCRSIAFLIRVALGVLLTAITLAALVSIMEELFGRPELQAGMVLLGVLLVGLWFLWAMLPHWMQRIIRRLLRRKERGHEQ